MSDSKALTLLGFAAKAGRLSYGMDAAVNSLKSGKARLAVAAGDVSPKCRKEAAFYAEKNNTPFLALERLDIKTVSDAVGRRCGILSINDSGFADAFLKAYTRGGNANDE
ncbi:MAG: L7Ae/L30e/S12e/Gadd45 family ribosomal protein [Acutalibacteraceae bacterium]